MRVPDRLKKEENRSFRWWLDNERKKGEEYEEAAILAEFSVPRLLIAVYPTLTVKSVFDMCWRDVILRVDLVANQLSSVESNVKPSGGLYSNWIRNTEVS